MSEDALNNSGAGADTGIPTGTGARREMGAASGSRLADGPGGIGPGGIGPGTIGPDVKVTRLLAARSARTHRKAWAAVFAALALTSLLLGSFGLALGSAVLGHARVERYAAADLVVAGNQNTAHTAKELGGTTTVRAGLTERVRVPDAALDVVRNVPGVEAAVADRVFQVGVGGAAAVGRPWPAARLAPYALRDGRAPRGADEVVVERGVARAGERVVLRVAGADTPYTVVGVTDGPGTATGTATGTTPSPVIHFSEETARRLSGHRDSLDAVGVVAEPGVSTGALAEDVRQALAKAGLQDTGRRADGDPSGLRVLTGDERGAAAYLGVAPARSTLLALFASVAGTVVLVSLLVVASTTVQALRQRSYELGLLRAVGATPGQVRGAVGREVGRIAAVAAACGALVAVPGYLVLRALPVVQDALPAGLVLPAPVWLWAAPLVTAGITVLMAWLAALIACAGTVKARPAEALRETEPGQGRRISGLVLLGLGVTAAGTATTQSGQAAGAAAGGATITMVTGCALLGPWIATGAMRVLGAPMRRLGGSGGRLAAADSAASAVRLGAAITPIVLVTAFVCVQLASGATVARQADEQARAALRAGLTVGAEGGLPGGALDRIRRTAGVSAATDVVRSSVVLAGKTLGAPELEPLPVLGVTAEGLERTLDPEVTEGSVADLAPGTVAVGADRARSLGVRPGTSGDTVTLRFGDGQEARLRVVATYERFLAFGDFLLSRDELLRHMSVPGPARVLVALAPDADPARTGGELAAALPGARVDLSPGPVQVTTDDAELVSLVTVAVVGAIAGFTVIAVLSTLSLIAVGRRPELRLLRLAGAGRRPLRSMLTLEAAAVALTGLVVGVTVASVPLLAFALALAGSLPYLPPVVGGLVVAVVAVTAVAGTLLPLRPTLRGTYPLERR
ncbi:FtsX-like permease family protein [Streptomyces sp. NRRL F-5135]|uniref:FtsX-like permease family protein n=1 Tax=Streptomyces sp. NRRL F-5135 TaxID=1463858 RepID=UPI000B1200ED|nr:FtsX-like permease family protein [Streptomyces sp. NRRL F-5135]